MQNPTVPKPAAGIAVHAKVRPLNETLHARALLRRMGPGALCSPDLIGRLIRKANPVQGLASQLRRRPHLAMMILACPVAELIARRGPYFAIAS